MGTITGKQSQVLCILILIIITAAAYWRLPANGFIVDYDDGKYVTKNQHITTGLSFENIRWAFTTTRAANWHPLTWISHMVDCGIYGVNPTGHHITNLLLHIVNAILLFLLLDRITGCRRRSLFVAVLFAIHPLHVESVAWVAERKDVLSTLFWMLTLWAYVFYVARPSIPRYSLMVIAYILGLLTKPMLVSLPLILLMLDFWPLRRSDKGWIRLIIEKLPLCTLAVGSCAMTYWAQSRGGAVGSFEVFPVTARIANAFVAYISYIAKMFWPGNLAVIYPHPGVHLPMWQGVGAAALFIVVSIATVKMVRTKPYIIMGWLWYVATLIPVIGLVQVGQQAMADRYTYIPLTGIFVALTWGIADILRVKPQYDAGCSDESIEVQRIHLPFSTTLTALVIIFLLGVRTDREVGYWQDGETLFTRAVAVTPPNFIAQNILGNISRAKENWGEAADHYEEALRAREDPDSRKSLAVVLFQSGDYSGAAANFQMSIKMNPRSADSHKGLALALSRLGNVKGAADEYAQAIELMPKDAKLYYDLGSLFAMAGQLPEAIPPLKKAIKFNPSFAQAHHNLGLVYLCQRKTGQAIIEFKKAIQIDPREGAFHIRLATAYYMKRSFASAAKEIQEAEDLGNSVDPELKNAIADGLHKK